MARIRTIKPEFFTSESVLSISPLARLFFVGLWCEADREGRLKWKPKTLKFRYLPADSVNIEKLCSELESENMIVTYAIDGVDYCEIPGFKSHQVINNRERVSEIPPRDDHASPRVKAEGRKERKEGKEGNGREPSRFAEFWNLYAKKTDSKKCEDKFNKLTDGEIDLIFEKLPEYVKSTPDKQFRKNPITWLNGKCWNDEIQALLPDQQADNWDDDNWHKDLGM